MYSSCLSLVIKQFCRIKILFKYLFFLSYFCTGHTFSFNAPLVMIIPNMKYELFTTKFFVRIYTSMKLFFTAEFFQHHTSFLCIGSYLVWVVLLNQDRPALVWETRERTQARIAKTVPRHNPGTDHQQVQTKQKQQMQKQIIRPYGHTISISDHSFRF